VGETASTSGQGRSGTANLVEPGMLRRLHHFVCGLWSSIKVR